MSDIKDKKDNWHDLEKIQKLHLIMSQKGMWIAWIFTLTVAVVFDIVPYPYVGIFGKVFDYNLSNLIAVLVVVWTFVTTIMGYWLNKSSERIYGIKVIQWLLIQYGMKNIVLFIGIVILELLFIIGIAIFEWEITATVLALQLVYTVVYAFLSFCVIPTKENALQQIKKEFANLVSNKAGKAMYSKGVISLSLKALRGEKGRERNGEEVLEILGCLSGEAEAYLTNSSLKNKKEICDFFKLLAEDLLKFDWRNEEYLVFFRNWAEEGKTIEEKLGFVAVLLDKARIEYYRIVEKVLKTEHVHFRELYVWTIVYLLYCQRFEETAWQRIHIKNLQQNFGFTWCESDTQLAINFWKIICGENVRDFRIILRFVKSNEGKNHGGY